MNEHRGAAADLRGRDARRVIEQLAAIERGSCSPGEREAAEWIAAALREQGAQAWVERPRVHGSYWWPLGLTSAAALLAACAAGRRRVPAGAGAALATAAAIDDLGVRGRRLRRLLPKRATANVVALAGDQRGGRTLVLVAHHDAAHSGTFFNPRLTSWLGREGRVHDHMPQPPRVMAPIVVGPALVSGGALAGSRWLVRLGAALCAGLIGSFVDIALRSAVPGANDNLTGVATLLAVARSLAEEPISGLRVMLVSTGAEEALMEGMCEFIAEHAWELPPASTQVLCIDTLGSPHLVLAEGEGMLRDHPHDARLKRTIQACADDAGITLQRGMVMRVGTDAYVALRHGYPVALLMSVGDDGVASNYHWPTDTPERVDYDTCVDAIVLCERVVRRLADHTAKAHSAV